MENKNLTIMFTDIKGFTQRTSQQSRSATADLIKQHNDLLVPIFEERGGRVIKTIGDAFLVVFESPTNAVLTGMQLQERLRAHNDGSADPEKLEVRVAISTGEVSLIDNDVYGEAVNIASRLESVSEANEVYFTEATYLAMNRAEVPTAEIGYRLFKGIPDKIKIFKVLREGHDGRNGRKATGASTGATDLRTPAGGGAGAETKTGSGAETNRKIAAAAGASKACAENGFETSEKISVTVAYTAQPAKEFGFVIVPICMFLFGALGRVFQRPGEGFMLGMGAGFLMRAMELRRGGRRCGGTAFAAGFFLAMSLGIIFKIKAAAPLLAIACGLLLMTYFKKF